MDKRTYSDIKAAYEKITKTKNKFGIFHKVIFHLHTPESYDYTLLEEWSLKKYKDVTDDDLYNLSIERKALPEENDFKEFNLKAFNCRIFENNEDSYYKSKKECISYMLLANSLLYNDIELAVVCDHNSIGGIKKLINGIEYMHKLHATKPYVNIVYGIEISCADRVHVVGIFDNKSETLQKIESWLSENLITIEDGTFLTSLDVMLFFESINALSYIAHLNTSDIFKKTKFLSGGYKKALFSKFSRLIGISKLDAKEKISEFIKNFTTKGTKVNYILENDSHNIDKVNNNHFWIKGNMSNFKMIKEALLNFDISVSYKKNFTSNQYIQGLYISYEEDGFLSDKCKNNDFCIKFSDSLNCFIGGRGTGKSTVLEMINFILGQKCNSKELLDFLCNHGNAWLTYIKGGKEYIVELLNPYKEHKDDDILMLFEDNKKGKYKAKYVYDALKIEKYTKKEYINVFEVTKDKNDDPNFNLVNNKEKILKELYHTRYSINELVNIASDRYKINEFIYHTLFQNSYFTNIYNKTIIRSIQGLKKQLLDSEIILKKREKRMRLAIDSFNSTQENILKINYSQTEIPSEPPIREWLYYNTKINDICSSYNIKLDGVISYLLSIYDKVGFIEFLSLAIIDLKKNSRKSYSIIDYTLDYKVEAVNKDLKQINKDNELEIIEDIFDNIVTHFNRELVISYWKEYLKEIEGFHLEFNINNKEASDKKGILFKDVKEISLGQKVVAMLNFILAYSDYSKDHRPLIIDQPEDNLDNQYIYKNLVRQLKYVKTKRQVIIATHNATIVTNTMTDNVCVMESDNKHGWVSISGYVGEKKMKKSIINYLEGGKDSFNHKTQIYNELLD